MSDNAAGDAAVPGSARFKADDIVLAIEDAIASGGLSPGELLRQEQLAEEFGVSRTPIREALRRLEQRGLVTVVSNRSARVRELSRVDLREAFLVRAELEARAAELAATAMTDAQRSELRAIADAGARVADEVAASPSTARLRVLLAEFVQLNDRFHDLVLDAAGVKLLQDLSERHRRSFSGHLLKAWNGEIEALFMTTVQQHEILCVLLESGSATAARAAMHAHIISSHRLLDLALFGDTALSQYPESEATEEAQ
ncbi:MAG: GntR family transcriptional regulator [Actinomycetota bacterium]